MQLLQDPMGPFRGLCFDSGYLSSSLNLSRTPPSMVCPWTENPPLLISVRPTELPSYWDHIQQTRTCLSPHLILVIVVYVRSIFCVGLSACLHLSIKSVYCCCLQWSAVLGWYVCCAFNTSCNLLRQQGNTWKRCSNSFSWLPHIPSVKRNSLQLDFALSFHLSRFVLMSCWFILNSCPHRLPDITYLFVYFEEWINSVISNRF